VLGFVDDPVDAAREGKEVLGLERGDEAVAQRALDLALGVVPSTPTGRKPSSPPQRIASTPLPTTAAPTRPPTSACPELDGSPSRHVHRFHATAASSPAPMTSIAVEPPMVTIPPIVFATAAPTSSGPSMLKTAASRTACSGLAVRVATSAAIAFEAS